MSIEQSQIQFRGRALQVPSSLIEGREVIAVGRWPRLATLKDEEWIDSGPIADPAKFIDAVRLSDLDADIFSFPGTLDAAPFEVYDREPGNLAVIQTQNFTAWWDSLPQEARKNARRAAKKGIEVRTSVLDDTFVSGIKAIYDETPLRQGRKFWHYGKDVETIKRENSTYLDRSQFIGAYHAGTLVGFIKLVYVGNVARMMQILCMNAHQDKRPIIALIVKAAEICHSDGIKYLVYGRYNYGNKSDSMTEFKHRLGFTPMDFPRYYVPLTISGRIALAVGAHRSVLQILPSGLIDRLRKMRTWHLQRKV